MEDVGTIMIQDLISWIKNDSLKPYIKSFEVTNEDNEYTRVTISSENGHVVEVIMGEETEVNHLELDAYYIDTRIEYDLEGKREITEAYKTIITELLHGNFTEKLYVRNGKGLKRELSLKNDVGNVDGLVPRKISLWHRFLCHLPGTVVTIVGSK